MPQISNFSTVTIIPLLIFLRLLPSPHESRTFFCSLECLSKVPYHPSELSVVQQSTQDNTMRAIKSSLKLFHLSDFATHIQSKGKIKLVFLPICCLITLRPIPYQKQDFLSKQHAHQDLRHLLLNMSHAQASSGLHRKEAAVNFRGMFTGCVHARVLLPVILFESMGIIWYPIDQLSEDDS